MSTGEWGADLSKRRANADYVQDMANHVEIRSGDQLLPPPSRMTSAIEEFFGSADQRVPYLGAAYLEWPDERPSRYRMRLTLTCHQCGTELDQEWSGFSGFVGGYTDPCPVCGNKIEVVNYREWDRDLGVGLWLFVVPYTRSQGAGAHPIEIRSLDITAID